MTTSILFYLTYNILNIILASKVNLLLFILFIFILFKIYSIRTGNEINNHKVSTGVRIYVYFSIILLCRAFEAELCQFSLDSRQT